MSSNAWLLRCIRVSSAVLVSATSSAFASLTVGFKAVQTIFVSKTSKKQRVTPRATHRTKAVLSLSKQFANANQSFEGGLPHC